MIKLFSWVVRGKQRAAVLKALSHEMTPSQIHKKTKHYNEKVSLNNCSDVLRRFVKMEIAICRNEDAKTGRIYALTEAGESIRNKLFEE